MSYPMRCLLVYAATAFVMMVLDALWLGVVARPLYTQGIGHLMAEQPRWAVAVMFYVAYAAGLVVLVVLPQSATAGLAHTALYGALFGLFAYGTYDLTNLATLRGWPVGLSLLDMAWGTLISALSSVAGKAAWDRLPAP